MICKLCEKSSKNNLYNNISFTIKLIHWIIFKRGIQFYSASFLDSIPVQPPPHLRLVVTVVVVYRRRVAIGIF